MYVAEVESSLHELLPTQLLAVKCWSAKTEEPLPKDECFRVRSIRCTMAAHHTVDFLHNNSPMHAFSNIHVVFVFPYPTKALAPVTPQNATQSDTFLHTTAF